jgi:hypothetical protein
LLQEALVLLEQSGVPTRVGQQLQWQVLNGCAFDLSMGVLLPANNRASRL